MRNANKPTLKPDCSTTEPSSSPPIPRNQSACQLRLTASPHIEVASLEDAVDNLKRSAKAFDEALTKNGSHPSATQLERVQGLMLDIDQTLAPEVGLPGRSWNKNLVYAPGRDTGYEAKTLPGVREAIEERRWSDAHRYAELTASAINAYSDRLDQATIILNGK